MRVRDLFPPQLSVDVDVRHAGVERTWADERVRRDQVLKPVAAHGAELVVCKRGLELEDSRGAAPRDHLVDRRVVQWDVIHRLVRLTRVRIRECAALLLHHRHRVVDHGEGLEAQEVHLEHARLVEAVHVVLGDDHRVFAVPVLSGLDADRYVVVDGAGGDHHTGGVNRSVTGEAFERDRVVEELFVPLVEIVVLLHLFEPVHGFLDCEGLSRRVGNQLGDLVGLGRLESERPTDVTDHCPRLHSPERDDLADRVLAVLVARVLDDFRAPLIAEIDVDIRHRDAFRIQEALKQEIECDGVQVRNAQRVRHERASCRPTSRTDRDVVVPSPADEVLSDQEVPGVPCALDDAHFVVETFLHHLGERIAVALLRALEC